MTENTKKSILILSDINSYHTFKWVDGLSSDKDLSIHVLSIKNKIINFNYPQNVKLHFPKTSSNNFFYMYILTLLEMYKILFSNKIDIIHAHYITSYGLLGALQFRVKLIISIWGSDILVFPLKSILHKIFIQLILYRADMITATSEVLKSEACKYTSKNIFLVPFGIHVEKFRMKKKISRNKVTFGVVKSLQPVYRIDQLIQAFTLTISKFTNIEIHLIIVGSGKEHEYLQSLIKKNKISNICKIYENIEPESIYNFFKQIDIFVNPCPFESFGVSTLEAMASDTPIIASNKGGSAEILENNISGILIDVADIELLSKNMFELSIDYEKRKFISENAKKRVTATYHIEISIKKIKELYSI